MVQASALGNAVCRIHAEERKHQQHLGNQNQIGVQGGPTAHFGRFEPGQSQAVSAHKKHNTRQHHEGRQDFKRANEHVVHSPKPCKHAVRAQQPIDQDLQQFDVDDHKAHVDEDVHDACHRPGDHFSLSEGHAGHHFPSVRRTVKSIDVLAHQDVVADESHSAGEESRTGGHAHRE